MIPLYLVFAGTAADQSAAGTYLDSIGLVVAVAFIVVTLILIVIFRERRKKNKYDPKKITGKAWTRWGPWPVNE